MVEYVQSVLIPKPTAGIHRATAAPMTACFLIPETKGLSLEQMDKLFGMTYVAENGQSNPTASTEHESIRKSQDGKGMTKG